MVDREAKFTFHLAEGKKFSSLADKENQELLLKWSIQDNLWVQMFTFDQSFQPYEKDDFVLDFLRDQTVVNNLKISTSSGLKPLGIQASKVTADVVPCTILSMTFFDRLEGKVVRESGYLHKCFDEFYGDFTISDELRKMLLVEESDHYCLYSDSEREEFLFQLFQHLCLGGQVCQYEDTIDPYLNLTKQIYKDLVSVQKNPETKELSITSSVFKITAADADGAMFYPDTKLHEQTFSYLIVDPLKRHVTVFYHKFGGGIFR